MVETAFDVLQIVVVVLAGFPLLYLLLLSILAFFAPLRSSFHTSVIRRFTIVIPSHNEEGAIARTLESLFRIDYPRDHFDVLVVADNCTDKTANIARSMGASVSERSNAVERGKGYALRWCFDRLLAEKNLPDAIVVIDADSIASSNFLSVMNFYLERGARALQSSDLVEPQPGVWSAEATRLGFALYNYVRPLGRRTVGGHAGAHGNGMCFAVDVLRQVPWNAYTQSEDLEYGLNLLLHGIPVAFAPEAVVLATMPSSARNAESQRSRWEVGRMPIIKRYAWRLLMAAFRNRSFVLLDALISLLTPSLVVLLFFSLIMSVVSIALGVAGITSPVHAVVWLGLATAGILHLILGVVATGDRSLLVTMLHIPRYVAWKLLLYLKMARKGHTHEWVRTTRERNRESFPKSIE